MEERLRQLTVDVREADESELPAIIREFQQSPLGRRVEGAEEAAQEVRQCRCAEVTCGHSCVWTCKEPCQLEEPTHCEDCFAFVPNLLTFCHCGQEIVAY